MWRKSGGIRITFEASSARDVHSLCFLLCARVRTVTAAPPASPRPLYGYKAGSASRLDGRELHDRGTLVSIRKQSNQTHPLNYFEQWNDPNTFISIYVLLVTFSICILQLTVA